MFTSPVFCLLAAVVAQPPDVPPFVKEYSRIGDTYYLNPDPKIGPKMLRDLLKKENLEHPFFIKREDVPGLIGRRSAISAPVSPKSSANMNPPLPTRPPQAERS